MEPFRTHTGVVAPLGRANIDTDAIIPKQFLKRIERTGFGQFLFFEWRNQADGTPIADFVLAQDAYKGASILVAGPNFGCGSSREHAPWALLDYGFRAIIATSFADIFFNNCFKNGILPIVLKEDEVTALLEEATQDPGITLSIDLEAQKVKRQNGTEYSFAVDSYRKQCLLNGLDDIGLTLKHEELIAAYEKTAPFAVSI